MDMRLFDSAAAAACMMLAACTAGAAAPSGQAQSAVGRQCFNARSINGFDAIDDRIVLVNAGNSNNYELQIVGVCPDAEWSNRVALRSTGGSSWVCESLEAELLFPSPNGIQRCPVVGVRKISPEEAAALKQRKR